MSEQESGSVPPWRKRTPEQEAHRISQVQSAFKGKTPTDEQRAKRAEGLRRAWADGRCKPSTTPESSAKTAAKLRGRKRPQWVVEKIRIANTGKKRTPEQVAEMSRRVIEGWRLGKYRSSPEGAERRRLATIAAHKGVPRTEAQKKHHSDLMRGRKAKPEHIESRTAPMRGRAQTAAATAAGPTNHGSIEGALRDPSGRIWWFRNLTHFVRTHEELFLADDLQWRRVRPNKDATGCNAQKRLLCLFGRGRFVPGSWKGWTVADSTIERATGFADTLGRDLLEIIPSPLLSPSAHSPPAR